MLTASPGASVLIEGHAYLMDYRITLTLPGAASAYNDVTFSASQIHIEAQTTTDAPANSRLQPGYPVRSANFTLSGLVDARDATKTAAWLFGPYAKAASDGTVSPLYRQRALFIPVTIDLGVYVGGSTTPEWFRRFTGKIDRTAVDYTTGDVQVTCIDLRSTLKSETTLASVVTAPPYNAGLTSEFAIDALLRAATGDAISSWPAQRPQCVMAAGMRASLWPEVGSLIGIGWNSGLFGTVQVPVFTPGVMGTAVIPANGIAYSTTAPIGTDFLLEVWFGNVLTTVLVMDSSTGLQEGFRVESTSSASIRVALILGGVQGAYIDTGILASTCTRLRVQVHQPIGSTAWSFTAQGMGNGGTFSSGTLTAAAARTLPYNVVLASDGAGHIEALQVTTEAALPANDLFVPQAVLDPSLNPLTVVPPISGDPWQTIQAICDAELGIAGFNDDGTFFFKNRNTLASSPNVRDVTSKSSLAGLAAEASAGALFNHVKVDYTLWKFGVAKSVWSLDGAVSILPGQTLPITTTSDQANNGLFAGIDTVMSKLPQGGNLNDGNSYYRASLDSAGIAEHPGLNITVTPITSSTMRIDVQNTSNRTAWLVSSANYTDIAVGTPVLSVGGLPVTPTDTLISEAQWPPLVNGTGGAASDPILGDQVYSMPTNAWRQDPAAALTLANYVLSDGAFVRPNFDSIPVHLDPRLQIADRLHVIDDDVSGMDDYVRLWGFSLTLGPTESSMDISAVAIAKPGGWLLNVPGRSQLSVSTNL